MNKLNLFKPTAHGTSNSDICETLPSGDLLFENFDSVCLRVEVRLRVQIWGKINIMYWWIDGNI